MFLVADTQLYKSLCPSVGPLVRWSVGPSVHPSVREHESKSVKTRISAPAHPSATGMAVSGLVSDNYSLHGLSFGIHNLVNKPSVTTNSYHS